MSKQEDIRWKQRFENFDLAFSRLKEAVELEELNELERNGLIQRFEFTIELAWKVMKDYLEEEGFDFNPSPKDIFRQAQQAGIINYATDLLFGLELRNELSHDYSGLKFEASEKEMRKRVFPAIERLWQFFNDLNSNAAS